MDTESQIALIVLNCDILSLPTDEPFYEDSMIQHIHVESEIHPRTIKGEVELILHLMRYLNITSPIFEHKN